MLLITHRFRLLFYALPALIVLLLSVSAFTGDDLSGNVIKVTAGKEVVKINPQVYGFNAQLVRGPSISDVAFLAQVDSLHPGILRYPGGTVASYWDWKSGWFKDGLDLKKDWNDMARMPVMLEDLKQACNKTGSLPLFVLNMCNSTLDDQLEMLRHAKSIGMVVRYVELDNEVYLAEDVYSNRFADGKAYALDCNKWIIAIKREFPGVQISVSGYSSKPSDDDKPGISRALNWNREVLGTIQGADAMSFHLYGGSGLNFMKGLSGNGDKAKSIQAAFDKGDATSVILGQPIQRWNNSLAYDKRLLPSGMKAWYTEYNLFEREGVVAGTWVHGLYAVIQFMQMVQDPATGMTCYHNLSSSAQFAAVFNNNKGFAKSVKQKSNEAFAFSAAGHCFSLIGTAMQLGGDVSGLQFSRNTTCNGARGLRYASLQGFAVVNGTKKNLLMVNLLGASQTVDVTAMVKAGSSVVQVNGKPNTQVASPKDITSVRSKLTTKLTLPPYSVTLITSTR